jgi:hypothetical protein
MMSTTVMDLDGTDLSMVMAVVPREHASNVAAGVSKLVAHFGSDPAASGWRVASRSEAIVAFPDAWKDAPPWTAGNGDDVQRMAWLRDHFSSPVMVGFDHLAALPSGGRATGAELSELVGFGHAGGWKSSLSHAAVLCRRVGRQPIWEAERIGGVWQYYMVGDVRDLWANDEP